MTREEAAALLKRALDDDLRRVLSTDHGARVIAAITQQTMHGRDTFVADSAETTAYYLGSESVGRWLFGWARDVDAARQIDGERSLAALRESFLSADFDGYGGGDYDG